MKKTTRDYHVLRVYVAPYNMPIYQEFKAWCKINDEKMSFRTLMLIDDFMRSERKKAHDKNMLILKGEKPVFSAWPD